VWRSLLRGEQDRAKQVWRSLVSKGLVSIDRSEVAALLSTTPRQRARSSTNDFTPLLRMGLISCRPTTAQGRAKQVWRSLLRGEQDRAKQVWRSLVFQLPKTCGDLHGDLVSDFNGRTPSTTVCLRRLNYSLFRCTTHVPFVLVQNTSQRFSPLVSSQPSQLDGEGRPSSMVYGR
jgi:hypothetical protein